MALCRGSGPQGCGAYAGRLFTERGRLPSELNFDCQLLAAAVDLERHAFAGPLRRDEVAEPLDRAHRHVVGLDDNVAAEPVALPGEDDARRTGPEACAGGAAS